MVTVGALRAGRQPEMRPAELEKAAACRVGEYLRGLRVTAPASRRGGGASCRTSERGQFHGCMPRDDAVATGSPHLLQ
jgi:hypothetical protein